MDEAPSYANLKSIMPAHDPQTLPRLKASSTSRTSTLKTIKKTLTTDSAVPAGRLRSSSSVGAVKIHTNHSNFVQGINLPSFEVQYANSLPVQVIICSNYHSDDIVLKKGEQYYIHSIEHNTAITVNENDKRISELSLTSMEMFGLVSSINGSHSEKIKGRTFNSIAEILQVPELPMVLKCTSSKSVLVAKGDILIVDGTGSNSAGEEVLKTINASTKAQRSLTGTCIASFTTRPEKILLPLSTIVEYLGNRFPLEALAFSDEIKKKLVEPLSILTLDCKVEKSLTMSSSEDTCGAMKKLSINAPVIIDVDAKRGNEQGLMDYSIDSRPSESGKRKLSEPVFTHEYANPNEWVPCEQTYQGKAIDVDDQPENSPSFKAVMQGQIDHLKEEIVEIKEVMKGIKLKIDSLQIVNQQQLEPQKPAKTNRGSEVSERQIFDILSSMGLAQYEESFKRKGLTKDKLTIITDDFLKNDLEVKSKIHRTKLLEAFKSMSLE